MIVALQGGLGNQMFQYAFGASVAKARGEKLYFSRNRVDADPKREYALGPFNLPIEFAEEKEPFYYDNYLFDPGVYSAPKDSTFVGHWQTEKYFDDELVRSMFSKKLYVRYTDLGFLHVRRADYLLPEAISYHGLCSLDYYQRAVQFIENAYGQIKWLVFSDDPKWCCENFPSYRVVRGESQENDLWMMSECQNAIIANSSFSWWGSWLGDHFRQRIVIAPKRWYVNGPLDRDICPDRWVRLDN